MKDRIVAEITEKTKVRTLRGRNRYTSLSINCNERGFANEIKIICTYKKKKSIRHLKKKKTPRCYTVQHNI